MKKILLITLSIFSVSSLFALESFTGKVTRLEPTYLPGTLLFKMDVGNVTCPTGTFLRWSKTDHENNKAVYATLMTAMASGMKVQFHFDDGDTTCLGKYLHLVAN